jgi:hypothetical protein
MGMVQAHFLMGMVQAHFLILSCNGYAAVYQVFIGFAAATAPFLVSL